MVITYSLFLEKGNGWTADKRTGDDASVYPLPLSFITRVITYTYDHLYRLVDADYSTGEQFEYGYDTVGNRTVHTQTLTSTTVTTYTYDQANRLDYFYEDSTQTDLTWDDNGNLLAQGTSVYTWDAANRLTKKNYPDASRGSKKECPKA